MCGFSASAQNWQMTGFKKADAVNPILSPSLQARFLDPITGKMVGWENKNVLNPTALVRDGLVHLLYRAQDSIGTSRIGLATSADGIHFQKSQNQSYFHPMTLSVASNGQEASKILESWKKKMVAISSPILRMMANTHDFVARFPKIYKHGKK